ncbi:MAG TPA: c-type cytochrome, partial [Blastocatellia bacterium]|nr:c-type cytochrome [Blastocatellia bacterium]
MAETGGSEQLEKRTIETPAPPAPDPIADRSFSMPLLISALALIAVTIWSLYDELFAQRPWRSYQRDFVSMYTDLLEDIKPDQAAAEREVKESEKYQELDRALQDATKAAAPRVKEIDARVAQIDRELNDITGPFQDVRAWIAAQTFSLETASSEGAKASLRNAIAERKKGKIEVTFHKPDGSTEDKEFDFNQLEAMYNGLRDEKARLLAERIEVTKPMTEAQKKRDDYLKDNLIGLGPQQISTLIDKWQNFDYDIQQIHIAEGNVVDRCTSCHLGTLEPITITADMMDGEKAFTSHPNKELLRIHPPERFGCSTCHGGNGRGTTSIEKAHGRYKHWLWPLHYKENTQAGCVQCHTGDRVLQGADVLNHGRDLFQNKGCVGCHRYEGFDREADALSNARQTINQIEMQRDEYRLALEDIRQGRSEDRARQLVANADTLSINQITAILSQNISQFDTRIAELDLQTKYLLKDQKKVGPNLKEIKAKLRKEWLPTWLYDPQAFRPGTKMPTFRLTKDEMDAVAAFLWQSAIDTKVAAQPPGDANRGKELFKSIGCLACHSIDGKAIDMGEGKVGGDFAANLSRVGEKANYEYIVRWVHNPRQRLAPYSPTLKRDLTPEDYAKKGLPFVFDDEHSKSPVDGRELQIQNMTVMPNFRLSDQDARDIATFLMNQKRSDVTYPDASFLDDPALKAKGEQLVKQYGCAGCHEIRGLEEEQRIGTELTVEGSKPIERLDFALLTHDAKEGIDPITHKELDRSWYNHKGFFENKLRNPGIYDRGTEKAPQDRLKMPNIYLEEDEITALTTFMLGSVETALPRTMRYIPAGQKKQAQDGWWVIQKYNCMGCHNVMIGQDSVLMGLPMYQGGDGQEQLPPRLTTEGARVNPDWLLKFLKDPALSDQNGNVSARAVEARLAAHMAGGQPSQISNPQSQISDLKSPTPVPALGRQPGLNRNGVRPYLRARMPTFNFSPNELQTLVNFFMAVSAQQQPYIPEPQIPLTEQEKTLARTLFTSDAAPCLKCHIT